MRYWDTSALLKLYVTESDSARFRAEAHATGPVLTSDVARWEMFVALQRKEAAGDLAVGGGQVFHNHLESDIATGRVRVQPFTEETHGLFQSLVRLLYCQQPPVSARTLDALHLALAQTAQTTEFVTADQRQARAARALDFKVFP